MLRELNQTVSSIKEYYKVDANNNLQWKATLHGSFTYNGVSSQCTGASCTTTVYQGNWSEKTNNAYPSGNAAIADVTMVRKVLFITVETVTINITLSCDKDGNLT